MKVRGAVPVSVRSPFTRLGSVHTLVSAGCQQMLINMNGLLLYYHRCIPSGQASLSFQFYKHLPCQAREAGIGRRTLQLSQTWRNAAKNLSTDKSSAVKPERQHTRRLDSTVMKDASLIDPPLQTQRLDSTVTRGISFRDSPIARAVPLHASQQRTESTAGRVTPSSSDYYSSSSSGNGNLKGSAVPAYSESSSTITGPLRESDDGDASDKPYTVRFERVFSKGANAVLICGVVLNLLLGFGVIGFVLWPGNLPEIVQTRDKVLVPIMVTLMVIIELIRMSQTSALSMFAALAKDPVPVKPARGHRVAMLTTIVPGKEPVELVMSTLMKMVEIKYAREFDGVLDVWLLDEGNDPAVKAECEERGIKHFSRKGIEKYNQKSGVFKAKTKHGNHNAWRDANESNYDFVGQMDPDHIPFNSFAVRTLGYFRDEDVAFVVAPQVYGNINENWIAKGSAFLCYVFHAIIQRGGNGMAAPLLIGTNHIYRVKTFSQIGGYQDSIIEDHLTAMHIYATRNPLTGKYWKGVYTPDILSVGEGPTSFTDFFNQQKRWAYGIAEIIFQKDFGVIGKMKKRQMLSFGLLQSFYPSVAISWILSIALTALYMFSKTSFNVDIRIWAAIWCASIVAGLSFFMWLRRFNLVSHEQRDWGVVGLGLMLMTIPIYADAFIRKCTFRKLAYAVTAKGDMASPDNIFTFGPHLMWAAVATGMMVSSFFGIASPYLAHRIWLGWTLVICLTPIAIHYGQTLRRWASPPGKGKVLSSDDSDSIENSGTTDARSYSAPTSVSFAPQEREDVETLQRDMDTLKREVQEIREQIYS